MSEPKKIPHRPLVPSPPAKRSPGNKDKDGTKEEEETVIQSISIIGLGCSSFSTFFWSDDDWKRTSSSSTTFSADDLDPQHPIVQEWIKTIEYAILEAGITLLDTAPWYGHGTSEVTIGFALERLLATTPQWSRDSIQINTKVGRYEADPAQQFDFSYDTTLASVRRSLQRMSGCRYIDVLQLHDPEFAPTLDPLLLTETIPALVQCREEFHYCRELGMTGYPLSVQHQILQATYDQYQRNIWSQALTYGHYNLHDTSLVNRTFLRDNVTTAANHRPISFITYCHQHDIRVLTAAPLSMGLFTPQGPMEWHPAPSTLRTACQHAVSLCQKTSVDVVELALLFALSEPRIPCTLLGMANQAQVQFAQRVAQRIAPLIRQEEESSSTATETATNDPDPDKYNPLIRLQPILSSAEYQVLQQILDPEQGPFAALWKSSTDNDDDNDKNKKGWTASGYGGDWDLLSMVREFWKQVPSVQTQEWQAR